MTLGEQPQLTDQIITEWKRQIAQHWICRRCDNGDHKACEQDVRGMQCTCIEGECGVA